MDSEEKRKREEKLFIRRKRHRQKRIKKLCLHLTLFCALLMVLSLGMRKLTVRTVRLEMEQRTETVRQQSTEEKESLETETKESEKIEAEDYDELLILVNKEHMLPKDYEVELTELKDWPISVASVLYEDLREMLREGIASGLHFVVCSGYRSVQRQRELFEEDVRACMAAGMSYEAAYEETARHTMPPGYSEHSTGLALDIVARDYQQLDEEQEKTAENQWLRENAWRFGFILRYPKDKTGITGIDYEAWHFRYVGREAAKKIREAGEVLEEYINEQMFA